MIRKQLDKRAVKFMREKLSGGGRLASGLLADWPWQRARYSAYVNPGVSEKRLYDFELGGLVTSGEQTGGETASELLTLDVERTIDAVDGCCIAEHAYADCSDPFLEKLSGRFFCVNQEVYFWAAPRHTRREVRERILRAEAQPLYYGVVAQTDVSEFYDKREWPEAILAAVSSNARMLFMGAYDAESYIVGVAS